ncbi:MAG TPA: biotin--[acetyl-CoA-carboxylase] ligase [Gemmataceae bacterium]|nr:biotin--[acetyl-CoA-carboxylase] ligase [Gemmataceae bacterium]
MNPREEWQLTTTHLGRRVLVFDTLDSTNTFAASLAKKFAAALLKNPDNAGIVVLADEQTAGRGQHGRSWVCPGSAGVLMSLLLFPPPALRRPALLTAWAAVSVCETILRATGVQAKIKWPNDVLIQGRKVCGILIEQSQGTVVGIGLNVLQDTAAFTAAGLPEAASLALFSDRQLDRYAIARQLITELDEGYAALSQGDVGTLEACWKWRLGLLGKQVVAECAGETHRGRLREVAFAGLELDLVGGSVLRLAPETVRHLGEATE